MRCEYHENCDDKAVAKIGLPGNNAIWTCQRGFWEWRQAKGEKKDAPKV